MLIDNQVRESVSFLAVNVGEGEVGEGDTSQLRPIGTAFFVSEHLGGDRYIKFLVTSRHILDQTRPQGPLWLRAVSKDGNEKKMFKFPQDEWIYHSNADVAISSCRIKLERFDIRHVPRSLLADSDWMEQNKIGVGDHLAVPGFFRHHFGDKRDEPIVRFGRISHIPSRKLQISPEGPVPKMKMKVILAEISSWGGQSGSPVWVYFSVDRELFVGEELKREIPNPRIVGIVSGHYPISQRIVENNSKEDHEDKKIASDEEASRHVRLNSGIAFLTPAARIIELLETSEAKELKEEFKEILRDDGLINGGSKD